MVSLVFLASGGGYGLDLGVSCGVSICNDRERSCGCFGRPFPGDDLAAAAEEEEGDGCRIPLLGVKPFRELKAPSFVVTISFSADLGVVAMDDLLLPLATPLIPGALFCAASDRLLMALEARAMA